MYSVQLKISGVTRAEIPGRWRKTGGAGTFLGHQLLIHSFQPVVADFQIRGRGTDWGVHALTVTPLLNIKI
jgi:hypothetical protein